MKSDNPPQRIAIIGNAASGKTRLARRLGEKYHLPVTHIDSVQFIPPMNIRPLEETRKILNDITAQESWIIDGFGPLDLLEKRFARADKIIFIDLPLKTNIIWFLKRQIRNLWSPRAELPPGCDERSLRHTLKVLSSMRKMHEQMRPELIRILNREGLKNKLQYVTDSRELSQLTS